jgi:vesicle-fusing ATPase
MKLAVVATPDKSLPVTNLIYFNSNEAKAGIGNSKYVKLKGDRELFYMWSTHPEVATGTVALNSFQRTSLNASLKEVITVSPYVPKPKSYVYASKMDFYVGFTNKKTDTVYKVELLDKILKTSYKSHYFCVGQEFIAECEGVNLRFIVSEINCLDIEDVDENMTAKQLDQGILMSKTVTNFTKMKDSPIKIGQNRSNIEFTPDFNFEKMGIGGLNKEFEHIFRRAFASRVYPAEVIANLGIQHVKGMLLYGPPGTGKTLIARKIGEMLNARPPKLVNGPEVLNKFVGQSEENIRNLFADAEIEYKEKGEESDLHIIIFDELDAICKERGSRSQGGTGVGDSIVNQLLSKMDGVDRINNILVIGMTNRKDLIDEALLRPGRFEVHMEIGLPDEIGRVQILTIHTAKMKASKLLDENVSLKELAKQTKNFSGAELEGLVKSATSFALNRQIDPNNIKKPDPSSIKVLKEDFFAALHDVKPAFGVPEETLESYISNGIIPYGPHFSELYENAKLFINQVLNSSKTPQISILLSGKPGCGKSAFASRLALESGFPFIKMISPDDYIGYTETARVLKINKVFEDAYKSLASIIIVDDIERHLEYVRIGPRFSNVVLQALTVLFKKKPPHGRKLLIIGTTSCFNVLKEMSFLNSCNSVLEIPSIKEGADVVRILSATGGFANEDLKYIGTHFNRIGEIKSLLTIAETARQAKGGSLGERFIEICHNTLPLNNDTKMPDFI